MDKWDVEKELMRLFTSSQGDNLRQKGGIKSFDM